MPFTVVLRSLLVSLSSLLALALTSVAQEPQSTALIGRSIRAFGVLPENEATENAKNLQAAIPSPSRTREPSPV